MKRVIFVEPVIENYEVVLAIFNKYNPDSSFVNPHICLVFPFESDLNVGQIEDILGHILQNYNDFSIRLSGLSISYEEKNNFLFLNVIDASNVLKRISGEIYSYLGKHAILKGDYIPHITIGKSKSKQEIEEIYENASKLLPNEVSAKVTTILSKILITDTEGKLHLEEELEFGLSDKKMKSFK